MSTTEQQQLFIRGKQVASDYPLFDRIASSSSRRTLRTTAQDSSQCTAISLLEDQSEPIDPQPSDLNEPQPSQVHTRVDGHLGGAGQSQSNPRSTPGDRSASRRGVRGGKDSRRPPVRGNDRGRSRPEVRPNDPTPSRMLLVLILAYLYLT